MAARGAQAAGWHPGLPACILALSGARRTRMSEAASRTKDPAAIVEEFLTLHMIPDPERAQKFMAPDVKITFTGGRRFAAARDCTAFNKKRYKWVKKKFERTDVCPLSATEAVVYQIGTLYGEWP